MVLLGGGIVVVIVQRDDDGDEVGVDPAPEATAPTTAGPTTGGEPTTPVAAAPTFNPAPPVELPQDATDQLGDAFGELAGGHAGTCRPTDAFVHQTGGSPLDHPSLDPAFVCAGVVDLDGPPAGGPPVNPGRWLLASVITDEPVDLGTNIGYQPGIAIDRPDTADRPPGDDGQGIVRVPTDLAAFLGEANGWGPAEVFDTVDFSPLAEEVFGYLREGSRVQSFMVPADLLSPTTVLYFQSFGRQTPAGAQPSASDPAASYRVDFGPLGPCVTTGGGCTMPTQVGRFTVQGVLLPDGGSVTPTEVDPGSFSFGDQVELAVKILDACTVDGRYWVYVGSTPSAGFEVTVTDEVTGRTVPLEQPSFTPIILFDAFDAFATCP